MVGITTSVRCSAFPDHSLFSLSFKVCALLRKLKKSHGSTVTENACTKAEDLLVSAEEFVNFVGGGYDPMEAAEGRLRRVLALAEEQDGISLQDAFGALDKVCSGVTTVTSTSNMFCQN